jgi:hypothetical protein
MKTLRIIFQILTEEPFLFAMFVWCCMAGHEWKHMSLPRNKHIKRYSVCQRCELHDYELH